MIKRYLFLVGLIIPLLLIFKALFLPEPLVFGDAPYFYPEGLKELLDKPYLWTNRGENFGGINNFLWMYPLMFLYGALNVFFGLNNDLIIRIIFYFPTVILSVISPFILTRYLGYPKIVTFFAALLYSLNTYFLLLVDGGQVGVSLAYGFFPLALLFMIKMIEPPKITNFLFSFLGLLLLTIFDFRFSIIALITIMLWKGLEFIFNDRRKIKNILLLIPLILLITLAQIYWLVPFLKVQNTFFGSGAQIQFLSLLNSLMLFQPHWPENEFGKISQPPFYFIGIPLLIFAGLALTKKRAIIMIGLCFLIIGFLAKGTTPPLGFLYEFIINNIPYGVSLRDSSKFFAPLILFAGILIGLTAQRLHKVFPQKLSYLPLIIIYVYLLFLISPALVGNLNGVLAGHKYPQDFFSIYQNLNTENSFFRTVWFPSLPPFVYQTQSKPALDASKLVGQRPFASLNTGTFDRFNFLHDSLFLQWFDLLGIKYLIFSGDYRKDLKIEEQKDWDNLLSLVATNSALIKKDWGTKPVYSLKNVKPRIYKVDQMVMVVGGDDIYRKLNSQNGFNISNQAFTFLEDGKLNPYDIQNIASNSAILVFNNKERNDLTFGLLQRYFVSPWQDEDNKKSSWAIRDADDYLKYKYELLISGLGIYEFDYGKGLAFSTQPNEVLGFDIDVPHDGNYIFAVRSLAKNINIPLEIETFGTNITYNSNGFEWFIQKRNLKKGKQNIDIKNQEGLHVVNTVALIPEKDWQEAEVFSGQILDKFDEFYIQDQGQMEKLITKLHNNNWTSMDYKMLSPEEYEVVLNGKNGWLIFSDAFHQAWKSWPFYSMINGYYIGSSTENIFVIKFQP